MQEEEYNATFTEAVAVFHDAQSLQATIDELLSEGFDHAELSVLASEQAIRTSSATTIGRRPSLKMIPMCQGLSTCRTRVSATRKGASSRRRPIFRLSLEAWWSPLLAARYWVSLP